MKKGFMKSMSNFIKAFEDSMVAATFAEAGEHDTARKYLEKQKNAHKKILFATNAEKITPKTLGRAVSICKRIGAMLEVFHVLPATGSQGVKGNGSKGNRMTNLSQIAIYLKLQKKELKRFKL